MRLPQLTNHLRYEQVPSLPLTANVREPLDKNLRWKVHKQLYCTVPVVFLPNAFYAVDEMDTGLSNSKSGNASGMDEIYLEILDKTWSESTNMAGRLLP